MKRTVCVVGGGLAGGIVSSVLAAEGHSVTLVEYGDAPVPLLPKGEVWEGTDIEMPFTRGSGMGGTSNFWHGGLTVLDRTDVDRAAHPSRSARTPIEYDKLREYYARAVALVRDGGLYSLADIEAPPDQPLDGFDVRGRAFRLKALLYPDAPFCTRALIERARRSAGLRVVPNVEIHRLAGSRKGWVDHADGIDLKSGASRRFSADIFVLCAGGLGSPKILLQSVADIASLGKLPIGRFIIDHPTGFVFKGKLRRRMDLEPLFGVRRKGYKQRYGFALKADQLARADGRNHILYLRPALSMKDPSTYDALKRKLVGYRGKALRLADMAYLLRHADLLYDAVNFKYGFSHSTTVVSGLVFAEQFPNEGACISMLDKDRFRVKWQVTEEDRASLEKFLDAFHEDFSELFDTFRIFPGMTPRLDSAGHHSGACRMSEAPAEGVVDADLKVFGTGNLFVADGSVLAHSGHANTGLTIAALALKCCAAVSEA